jgi:cytochrome c
MMRDNWMTFPGIEDAKDRATLIAYLRGAGQTPAPARPLLPSLKTLEPRALVTALRHCGDTYFVTTGDGATKPFWEFNLRFKTNSTPEGPQPGKPAILRAGMMGDRATIVFASPAEISRFIEARCD